MQILLQFLRQSYNFKFHDEINQDFCGCPHGFVKDGKQFWDEMLSISNVLATAFAVALNVPADHFIKMMGTHKETALRLLHYPALNKDESYGNRIRCGEHTDYCLFTLVYGNSTGLQVRATSADSWVDVSPNPMMPLCTFGGLMERSVNDVWKATPHRVIIPPAPQCYESRQSLGCFFAPETHAVSYVHPNIAPPEDVKYKPITTNEYFRWRLEANGEKVDF